MNDMSMSNTNLRLKINQLQNIIAERDRTIARLHGEIQRGCRNNERLVEFHDLCCVHGENLDSHCAACAAGES